MISCVFWYPILRACCSRVGPTRTQVVEQGWTDSSPCALHKSQPELGWIVYSVYYGIAIKPRHIRKSHCATSSSFSDVSASACRPGTEASRQSSGCSPTSRDCSLGRLAWRLNWPVPPVGNAIIIDTCPSDQPCPPLTVCVGCQMTDSPRGPAQRDEIRKIIC